MSTNLLFDPFARLRAGGVRIYGEYDGSMAEQARWCAVQGFIPCRLRQPPSAVCQAASHKGLPYTALGSTRRLINSSQTVTDTYSYEAFGDITASSGSTYNPYRCVGILGYYRGDPTSGLLHLGARYYNPSMGRFATQDPLWQGPNWYAYVDNNPTTRLDPSGLTAADPCQNGPCAKNHGCRQSCQIQYQLIFRDICFASAIVCVIRCHIFAPPPSPGYTPCMAWCLGAYIGCMLYGKWWLGRCDRDCDRKFPCGGLK